MPTLFTFTEEHIEHLWHVSDHSMAFYERFILPLSLFTTYVEVSKYLMCAV